MRRPLQRDHCLRGLLPDFPKPNKVARLLLAAVVCSTVFADYWEYSRTYHSNPDTWMDVIRGTASAPQQYRIGVPFVANLIRGFGHAGLRHGFALIDLFSAVLAVNLLYSLFSRSRPYRESGSAAQWFGTACFLFLLQYYLFWITWYQKPETLASAAVLVCTVWLVKIPLGRGGLASECIAAVLMLVLAAVQAFIRADVIFVFHLGLIFGLLITRSGGFAVHRSLQVVTSGVAVLLSGGIQYWIIHILYPHATYGTTRVVQVVQNVTNPLGWFAFALFMFPSIWLYSGILRQRMTTEGSDAGLVTASLLYLGMWFALGRIEEVRIFLPYSVALVPLTCEYAMRTWVCQSPAFAYSSQSET